MDRQNSPSGRREGVCIGEFTVTSVFDGTRRENPTDVHRVRHSEFAPKGFEIEAWLPCRDPLDADGLLAGLQLGRLHADAGRRRWIQ